MNKYDNYVFLYICEISLQSFKKSKFNSYLNYCANVAINLDSCDLSKQQMIFIDDVIKYLDRVFSMSDKMVVEYIIKYFHFAPTEMEKFVNLIKLTNESFKDGNKVV